MEFEKTGRVTNERVSDTGDPSFDFDLKVGGTTVPNMNDLLSSYEGDRVRVKIVVERIYNEDIEEE